MDAACSVPGSHQQRRRRCESMGRSQVALATSHGFAELTPPRTAHGRPYWRGREYQHAARLCQPQRPPSRRSGRRGTYRNAADQPRDCPTGRGQDLRADRCRWTSIRARWRHRWSSLARLQARRSTGGRELSAGGSRRCCSTAVTIVDDHFSGSHGLRSRPFDGEGLSPTTRLIDRACFHQWLLDSVRQAAWQAAWPYQPRHQQYHLAFRHQCRTFAGKLLSGRSDGMVSSAASST